MRWRAELKQEEVGDRAEEEEVEDGAEEEEVEGGAEEEEVEGGAEGGGLRRCWWPLKNEGGVLGPPVLHHSVCVANSCVCLIFWCLQNKYCAGMMEGWKRLWTTVKLINIIHSFAMNQASGRGVIKIYSILNYIACHP